MKTLYSGENVIFTGDEIVFNVKLSSILKAVNEKISPKLDKYKSPLLKEEIISFLKELLVITYNSHCSIIGNDSHEIQIIKVLLEIKKEDDDLTIVCIDKSMKKNKKNNEGSTLVNPRGLKKVKSVSHYEKNKKNGKFKLIKNQKGGEISTKINLKDLLQFLKSNKGEEYSFVKKI